MSEGSDAKRRWRKVGLVVAVAQTGFKTLRDQVPPDSFIESNRLERIKHLGSGGFAEVTLSKLDNTRLVAVKTLHHQLLSDDKEIDLFFKEVKLLRKLRHGRIVEFIGVGGSDKSLAGEHIQGGKPQEIFLVQEYCSGGSLRELVYKQMCAPLSDMYTHYEALQWSIDIAKALAYLHGVKPKVVHRDLKLDNVLLSTADLSTATAKLADFGLAKLVAGARTTKQIMQRIDSLFQAGIPTDNSTYQKSHSRIERTLTRAVTRKQSTNGDDSFINPEMPNPLPTGESLQKKSSASYATSLGSGDTSTAEMTGQAGSYAYMAPEVLKNQDYDEKADIYSFGVMIYNLFYRVIPTVLIALNGTDEDVVLYAYKVANGYRPAFSDYVPAAMNDIINKCWSGIPSARPSAEEVLVMLEEVQASGVIEKKNLNRSGVGCECCTVM